MLPPRPQRLEHDNLACEMRRRQHVREQAQLVQGRVVDAVCPVYTDDARKDRVDAKQACGEGRDLVGRGGLVFEGRRRGDGLEFRDEVAAR